MPPPRLSNKKSFQFFEVNLAGSDCQIGFENKFLVKEDVDLNARSPYFQDSRQNIEVNPTKSEPGGKPADKLFQTSIEISALISSAWSFGA